MLRGGAEKVAEAGAELAGGHSIDDKEPKYGLAVTGVARPDEIVYNGGARPGDKLVLTKRLGIGVLATALKQGLIEEAEMMDAVREAAALNAAASRAMLRRGRARLHRRHRLRPRRAPGRDAGRQPGGGGRGRAEQRAGS